MVTKEEKWIRIFDVSDISRHKKGFTIYKVVSMLYPESCPDAITKITVWKRYNDFKRLHREMKALHRSMGLKDKYPSLPSSSFFSRFDDEVIQQRRQLILTFLEYVSVHSRLFTSNCFVKFFETSHTPYTMMNGSINAIRAELNLPSEPEYLSFNSPDSDNEGTLSDTDSVSTRSSLSSYVQINDYCNDCMNKSSSSLASLSKKFGNETTTNGTKLTRSTSSIDSYNTSRSLRRSVSCNSSIKEHDNLSVTNIDVSLEDCGLSERPDKQGNNSDRYIDRAERIISSGHKLEEEGRYSEAFDVFKEGIGLLLDHGRGDQDFDRKESVRHKIEKYLLRAEKIYNLHLSTETRTDVPRASVPDQRPVSDLYKLKVLKVVGSGMLVLHSELQQLFYVKVIYKSSSFNDDDMILPTKVPYMVRMHNFYNCENALFLVLEYSSGINLWDYIKQRSPRTGRSGVPNDTKAPSEDDEGSECSFSELVDDYVRNIRPPSKSTPADMNVDEMLAMSQELLSSVDATLQRNAEMRRTLEADGFEIVDAPSLRRRRKMSEASSCHGDDCELERNDDVPTEKVVVWAAQLLIAVEELHRLGIICCDIQTKNLLVNENDDLVLTYVCKVNRGRKVQNYRNVVTLAPETYRFETLTPAVDWWCYGTVLYELLVGVPLSCTHPEGILCSTMLKLPKFVSAEGRSLLKQLLVYDPQSRLGSGGNGAEEIKSHPFFNAVDWKALKSKGNV